jgi:NADP-dependent 3-hydroxy acid dehydrogenase YdfG
MNPLLDGPTAERQPHDMHKMTEAEARGVLLQMEREVPSALKRRRQAAFYASNVAGRLTDEAVALYRAYSHDK